MCLAVALIPSGGEANCDEGTKRSHVRDKMKTTSIQCNISHLRTSSFEKALLIAWNKPICREVDGRACLDMKGANPHAKPAIFATKSKITNANFTFGIVPTLMNDGESAPTAGSVGLTMVAALPLQTAWHRRRRARHSTVYLSESWRELQSRIGVKEHHEGTS